MVWSIHQNCDSLWVQVLKHKYIKGEVLLNINKKPGSVTWNAMMKALMALREGFEFRLGDGNSSFWYTNWSGIGKLAKKAFFVDIHDLHMRVMDVYADGTWNFNLSYTNIQTVVEEILQLIPMCLHPTVRDCYTWKENLNGLYSARDGYFWLNIFEFAENLTDNISRTWLWHIPSPEKLIFFFFGRHTKLSPYHVDAVPSWYDPNEPLSAL